MAVYEPDLIILHSGWSLAGLISRISDSKVVRPPAPARMVLL